ncbi:AfsR/SARP family transcriptional regulator [Saccharothrix longispora]|uniref:AfsR/SARP family transcriptional regulator n=1 Tax=Saccharothrix longispora TaxID=33920 RepID=UPI0028FDAD62|nr:BTAD domain-containing putative transcriptional regulator [Saccharothrix longispora]MDU0292303.1 BTAD domain-containing putative transcriptional regulator [Saccharothrix longispora]
MEFGLLGAVRAVHDGRVLPVGGARARFVLATLLLNGDRPTRADVLVEALWDRPPPTARAQLHNVVSKLRAALRTAGADPVESHPGGYLLSLDGHRLDLADFRRAASRGARAAAAGRHDEAATELAAALALWRGPALADVPDEQAVEVRAALHEERLAVVEAKLRADLALGRPDAVLRDVTPELAEHPFREGLWETRVRALVAAGRRADALAACRRVRRTFADELGIEPGPGLRALEQDVLRGEEPARAARHDLPPRELPLPIGRLTGRDEPLRRIGRLLRDDGASPVVLLVGRGGVGKSALAVTAAHQAVPCFPDGQLHVDLGGSGPRPADPHLVVGRALRALGVDGGAVPQDPDRRLGLYRSLLADRRVLLVLDDAHSERQVRPLLPGTAGCRVLVTSRGRLGALVGVERVEVPVLDAHAAVELFAHVLGRERFAAEPDAARAVVAACANLPLAVVVAAGRLAVQPHRRVAEFLDLLTRERGRLDELSVGDLDVRASIALSVDALDPPEQRLFRLLGRLEVPDWPGWVAGALLGDPAWRPGPLDRLVDLHLVEPLGADRVGQVRYRLHDLVTDVAREQEPVEEGPGERDAVAGVLGGWLALAAEADDRLPHGIARTADPVAAPPPAAAALAREAPADWFEAERRSLVAAVGQARRAGLADLAGALALRLSGFLWLRSYDDEWERELRLCVRDVRERGSRHLLARLLGALYEVCVQRDRFTELRDVAAEQVAAARDTDDHVLLLRALRHAGAAEIRLGRFGDGERWLTDAVERARHPGVPRDLLRDCLMALGSLHHEAGVPEAAVPLLREALSLAAGVTARAELCRYRLALVLTDLGDFAEAADLLHGVLAACEEMDDDLGTAYAEQALADVDLRDGRPRAAEGRLARARTVHERLGSTDGLAEVLRASADLAVLEGDWRVADTALRHALDLRRSTDNRLETARTLARLARVAEALGKDAAEGPAVPDDLDPACLRIPDFYVDERAR